MMPAPGVKCEPERSVMKSRVKRAPVKRGAKTPLREGRTSQPSHDTASVPLEKRIGEVLKQHRIQANLTLADVGEAAGMSSAMLSRVENGVATASLDSLERLCLALGIGLADLFTKVDAKGGTAQHLKRHEQMEVVRVGTRYGYTYKLLSYDKGPRKLFDPFFIEMDKKSQSYPRFAHPGTEFIYMLQGRVEYRFGENTYLLEPGDAFTFSGNVVHGPERLLDERVRFLSIIIYAE